MYECGECWQNPKVPKRKSLDIFWEFCFWPTLPTFSLDSLVMSGMLNASIDFYIFSCRFITTIIFFYTEYMQFSESCQTLTAQDHPPRQPSESSKSRHYLTTQDPPQRQPFQSLSITAYRPITPYPLNPFCLAIGVISSNLMS